MKRLILLSWLSILAGIGLILPVSLSNSADVSVFRISLGGAFLILPQAIWILAADRIASKSIQKPPSILINGLVVFFILGFGFSYGSLFTFPFSGGGAGLESVISILFPAAFAALFAAIILVSRRVVDAEENPKVARSSRIFVLCIALFYVAIGMFFIAPRLKRLQVRAAE